jgi:putative SOS response-associated peptidase YedK
VEGLLTLAELWDNSAKLYKSKKCKTTLLLTKGMGKRELVHMHKTTVTLSNGKKKEWLTPE